MNDICSIPADYQPASSLLADRVIAVTGAGDGIGRAAALSFAAHGATVILLGRTIAKLEKVYDEIEADGNPQPAIFPINFENAIDRDFQEMHDRIAETFGRLDGLLHNAATLGERRSIASYPADMWAKVMQVNVNAPFMMTRALLPLLDKSNGASIIFTSSSVAFHGRSFWGAYAASKAAADNLMQTLANELAGTSKTRCNSINPGATRTAMRATAYPAENPMTVKTPQDIMPAYLYLMGSDSGALSGQIFNV